MTSDLQLRDNICQLQEAMLQFEQVDIPIRHHFAEGLYAREMTMPEGAVVVGKIHKCEHLCIISQGDVSIVSEEFTGRVQAPFTYTSKPGAKRAITAHTETVWTTVHMTHETDIETLERELVTDTYDTLEVDKTEKLEG